MGSFGQYFDEREGLGREPIFAPAGPRGRAAGAGKRGGGRKQSFWAKLLGIIRLRLGIGTGIWVRSVIFSWRAAFGLSVSLGRAPSLGTRRDWFRSVGILGSFAPDRVSIKALMAEREKLGAHLPL